MYIRIVLEPASIVVLVLHVVVIEGVAFLEDEIHLGKEGRKEGRREERWEGGKYVHLVKERRKEGRKEGGKKGRNK